MIEDKNYPLLKNLEVDKCFGLHLFSNNKLGTIIAPIGTMTANGNDFEINIKVKLLFFEYKILIFF